MSIYFDFFKSYKVLLYCCVQITMHALYVDESYGLIITGRKFWSFSKLKKDNRDDERSKLPDQVFQISESCSQMVLQFRDQIEVIEV